MKCSKWRWLSAYRTLTNIINLSLVSGTFPDQFKSCSVIPLLKKYNLDKEDLSNYRPISHLSFLSKLYTERVVKNRLTTNNLLNSYLPTPSIILLSLRFLLFTTTSLSLRVNKKLLLYVSLIFLLPLILLIILFSFIASLLGLVLVEQLFLG